MIKVKDGYGKLIGSEYKGSADLVLLSDGSNLGYAIPSTGNTLVLRNTSGQIESSLTTDSNLSPFVVTSTVVNTNLNSDLLDGFHAGGLFLALSSSTSVNLTVKIGNTEKKIEKLYATYDGLGNTIATKYVTLDTALTISGVKTFSSLLKFTVASVAPFTVDSNIVVTNLNADLLDGTHKADLFTDFSNITSGTDANKVSITIGGTTKKIIINYAQNAGSIGGITAEGLFTDLTSTPAKNLSITIGGTTKDIISLYSNYWVPQGIGSKDFNTMYGDTYRGTSWYGAGSNTATNNPLGSGLAFGMLIWRNADGHTALLIMDSDGRLYIRVYNGSSWSQLLKFAYATDAGLGGGYWANLPVLAIADSTTTPTFGGVTVNGTSLLNGLVGIGILNPKAKLAVNISALSTNPTSGSLGTLNTMSVGAAGSYGTYFWTRGTGKGYIQVGREDGTATTYDLILQLLGGNVGIGTEDPTAKLDVLGYTKITASAGSSPNSTPLIVTGTGSNTGQRLIQAFSPNLPIGTTGAYGAHLLLGVSDTSYNFGYMKFVYAGAGSTNNALRFGFHSSDNLVSLLASGNMGVGTTTPIHKLDVSGSTRSNWHVFNKWGGQVGHASSAAWYNVYEGRIYTLGDNILLNLSHSYYYTNTDSITFQINVGYHNASITLLNSTSGSAIFLKIRVRFVNNEYVYIDVLIYSHTANTDNIYVSGLGTGTFKVPTATSDTTGTVKEISVFYNGFYTPAAKIDTLYGLIVQEISNIWINPARLQIGRPNSTVYSDRGCIGITDGNLHLDAYKNKAIYLNWYQAPGTTEGQAGTSVVITAAGNMGIGTAGPTHKLQVIGAGVFNNTNSTTYATNGITIGAGDAAARYITCYGKTGLSYINVGYGPGANNSAEFAFNYVGDGSSSNCTIVSMYGAANSMKMYPGYTQFIKTVTITYNSYPGLTIHNNTTSGESSIYVKNNTAGWALGVNTWEVGAGQFAIGQYLGTGSSTWRFRIDNNGYCYTGSYLNLGGGHEKNASSPTYVWGSNSSDTFLRSYQTSKLSVNYANSAGSAGSSGYIWGNSISNLNTPTTWSSDGTRLVYDTYSGSASNKPVSVDNANGLVTFFKSKHGVSNLYVSQLAFPDHSRFYFRYAANGSWRSWQTVAFTSDIPNPGNYYWANVRVSASSSTSTLPTFNTCYTSNWFRSTGTTGWYSESYGGGIHMLDSTWVRTYNGKSFYCSAIILAGNRIYTGYDSGEANSISCSNWFRSNGISGWYNPTYGCHVYPNNINTYGGLVLRGTKNGYHGFILGENTNYMNLMDNSNDKGLYQEGKSWILYYNRSNNRVGLLTSSLAGYAVTTGGDVYIRSGWVRTEGARGWYNESYGGGMYMEDSTWVRVYGGKKFYVANSEASAIHSAGGVYVAGAVHSYANLLKSTCNSRTISIGSLNSSWCHYSTDAPAHWFNKPVYVLGDLYGGSSYNRRLAYADEISNTWRGVENVLTSTSTSNSLTANMGRVLANGASDRPIVLLAGTLYRSGASSSYTTWYFTGYRHRSIASSNPAVYVSGGVARFLFYSASGYGFSFAQVCANHQASGEATSYQSTEYQTRSSGLFWFGTYATGQYLYIRAIALGDRHNDTAESYSGMWTSYSDGVTRVSIIAVGYAW